MGQHQHTGRVQRILRQLDGSAAGILPHHSGGRAEAICPVGHRDRVRARRHSRLACGQELDGDLVVYDVLENGLRVRVSTGGRSCFYGTLVQGADSAQWTSLDGKETRSFAVSTPVRMERRVPDLDYVTECDNRVWGCSSKENVIYACKLGRPHQLVLLPGHRSGQLCSDGGQRRGVYRSGHLHGLCAVL